MNPPGPSSEPTQPRPSHRAVDPMPELLRHLTGEDTDARQSAIADLGRLGPLAADALPALTQLLHHAEPHVRKTATRALGQLGAPAIPALSDALSHDDKEIRRQAIWALGRMGNLALVAIPAFCRALQDPDPRTASGAAQALLNLGPRAEPA